MTFFMQIIIIAGSLAAESMAFIFLKQEGLEHSHFWMCHALAVLFFGLYLFQRGQDNLWRDKHLPLAMFGFLLFTFFPGVGFLGFLLLLGYVEYGRSPLGRSIFEEYEDYISENPEESLRIETALNVIRQFRFEVGFEPFVDILLGDKVSFKATVIRKLSENVNSANLRLLQIALRDAHPEIRLYAAGALMKIEARLNEQIQKAGIRVKENGTFKEYSELGDLYRLYATVNRSGDILWKYYLQQSAEAYQRSIDINANQPLVITYYCQALLELGEFERAQKTIENAFKIWPENPYIVYLCNEVYFQLGDFRDIPWRFSEMAPMEMDEKKLAVLDFWKEAGAAAEAGAVSP